MPLYRIAHAIFLENEIVCKKEKTKNTNTQTNRRRKTLPAPQHKFRCRRTFLLCTCTRWTLHTKALTTGEKFLVMASRCLGIIADHLLKQQKMKNSGNDLCLF